MISKRWKLEIKLMGTIFIVPIIMIGVVVIISFLSISSDNVEYMIYSTFENVIPLFAGWWGIFSMYEFLEAEGGEIMLTYGLSAFSLGIKKNIYYLTIYLIISIVPCIFVMKMIMKYVFIDIIIQIIFQSLFFSAFSFVVMALVRNSGWSFFILVSYFVIAFFTEGKGLWIFNIYLFRQGFGFDESLLLVCLKCFGFALVFYALGNRFIKSVSF